MLDRLAIAALLAGCNQLYGLEETKLRDGGSGGNGELLIDLDRDGVSDDADDCIAPVRDGDDDLDADEVPARRDPCPFEKAVGSLDGDDIPEACDPFPGVKGDRLRCYMSFSSTDLNDLLWTPRDTGAPWTSREGELVGPLAPAPSSYVATLDLERAAQTTYDAFFVGSNGGPGMYAMRMWSRAKPTFDNGDLGCEISGADDHTRVAIVRGNDADIASTTLTVPFPKSYPVRIVMTLAPGATGMNVRCTFHLPMSPPQTVKARVDDVPVGRVAFGTEQLATTVSALAIYERDDARPLP